MTDRKIEELVSTIAACASDLGAKGVDLGHSMEGKGAAGELARVFGAKRVTRIHQSLGQAPCVIETVTVSRWNVTLRAQWERPPSSLEMEEFERRGRDGTASEHVVAFVSAPIGGGAG